MSSFMQSNQPYQRVDDGIGAGLISGAAVGGLTSGTANFSRKAAIMGSREVKSNLKNKYSNLKTESGMLPTEAQTKKLGKLDKQITRTAKFNSSVNKAYQTTHGSGKRKMASMAGSIIGGAIAGGTIDGLNG